MPLPSTTFLQCCNREKIPDLVLPQKVVYEIGSKNSY